MTTKLQIIIGVCLLLGGVAVGRYTAPTKTVVKVETKEVIKEVVVTTKGETKYIKNDLVTKIVEIVNKDGSSTKTTYIVDKGSTLNEIKEFQSIDLSKTTETKKETITENKRSVNINGMVYLKDMKPEYGLHISKQFLGPISIGAFGMQDKRVGLTVGLSL